jgi:L-ribulokinase
MVETMGDDNCRIYEPNPRHREVYEALYREYRTLHDYFGRGENAVMERLRKISAKSGNMP